MNPMNRDPEDTADRLAENPWPLIHSPGTAYDGQALRWIEVAGRPHRKVMAAYADDGTHLGSWLVTIQPVHEPKETTP